MSYFTARLNFLFESVGESMGMRFDQTNESAGKHHNHSLVLPPFWHTRPSITPKLTGASLTCPARNGCALTSWRLLTSALEQTLSRSLHQTWGESPPPPRDSMV
jgi:hypothetical protein